MEDLIPHVAPAVVLSVLVGLFHACLYLAVRARGGLHVLAVIPAAIAGAYVGQAVGARVGDPLPIGDFGLAWASILAWIGILLVAGIAAIRPGPTDDETGVTNDD
ncbi:MAG: hypothetical protein KF809_18185 [Chloroflexi bacterium]|nr:hypothetical protein [Chloroflexota bacterium]